MSARIERQRVLRGLLAKHDLRTQAEVREALSAAGHEAHPATIGRDLEEIGARRIRTSDGQLAYRTDAAPAIAVAPAAAPDVLDEALRRYVLRIDAAKNLLVLRTPPACASPVASALDASGGPAILGTLAGDDTVIAVVADGHDPSQVAEALRRRSSGAQLATSSPVTSSRPTSRTSPDRSLP
jgi:transcriptional regulator of arginine metabolism